MSRLATLLLSASLLAAAPAWADIAADACSSLRQARIHLVALVGASDNVTRDGHHLQVKEATARLDRFLVQMRDDPRAAKFRRAWEPFKRDRDARIIPAAYAGEKDAALEIALGIQSQRMRAMRTAMGCE